MKCLVAPALIMAASSVLAAPVDEVIVKAMRLAEEPSYRWTTTVIDDARSYAIEGRLADGWAWTRQPMVESIAVRLPWSNDDSIEAVFRGPDACVVLTRSSWQTLDELPRRHADWADDDLRPYIPMRNVGNLLTRRGQRPYSNAQFGLSLPHDELAIIVSAYHDLEVHGDQASGRLTNLGAQLLLVHEGQEHLKPVIAAGRFILWLTDDGVEKYQVELEGVLLVDGQECLVRQKSVTVIQDVGTTAFHLPEVARAKLQY